MNVTIKWSVEPDQTVTLVKETLNLCDLIVYIMGDSCPISVGIPICYNIMIRL